MAAKKDKDARPLALVTGGTGFLGAHLVRLLAAENKTRLRVLVHSAPPAWLRDRGGDVEIVSGSVTSPDGVSRIVMASTSGTVACSRNEGDVADEETPTPVDIISRWGYYASKLYQEEAARRACAGKVELVTVNPSLLLGPGDDRLSSTRPVLQFLAKEILLMPAGGLNVVDARDVAALLPVAMARGVAGSRYLLGAVNWTFAEFFGRLERLTKISAPKIKFSGDFPFIAARAQAAVWKQLGRKV